MSGSAPCSLWCPFCLLPESPPKLSSCPCGRCSFLSSCCCLQVQTPVFCLCASRTLYVVVASASVSIPLTGAHAPPQTPSTLPHMPQPQTKAQASAGQGSSCLPSTPSWSSLLLTLSSSSRQTTWDCGHRRGGAGELRAGQVKSLAKEALGRVAGRRPVGSCL